MFTNAIVLVDNGVTGWWYWPKDETKWLSGGEIMRVTAKAVSMWMRIVCSGNRII
jgi:hypothetical protein